MYDAVAVALGVGVEVDVAVGVGVNVAVAVGVAKHGVNDAVAVAVGVGVFVDVAVGVLVAVGVEVALGVAVAPGTQLVFGLSTNDPMKLYACPLGCVPDVLYVPVEVTNRSATASALSAEATLLLVDVWTMLTKLFVKLVSQFVCSLEYWPTVINTAKINSFA